MLITLCTAAATLLACAAVRRRLQRPGRGDTSHWGGRIRLTALWNSGAAFDLPVGRAAVLWASLAALPCVFLCRRRSPAGAGLVLGGGIANLWERLRMGRVYDYIRFPGIPFLGRYVFNLADAALFLGAVKLLLGRRPR